MPYHRFKSEDTGEAYGSFEVFHIQEPDAPDFARNVLGEGHWLGDDHADYVGFYWQACFPGCMPDGDPNGPFKTYEDAHGDALEQ